MTPLRLYLVVATVCSYRVGCDGSGDRGAEMMPCAEGAAGGAVATGGGGAGGSATAGGLGGGSATAGGVGGGSGTGGGAVGSGGGTGRDGGSWEVYDGSVAPFNSVDVWGTASDDIWVPSGVTTVNHWDGLNWSSRSTGIPVGTQLRRIHGSSTQDVWLSDAVGNLYHWAGTSWSLAPKAVSSTNALMGIHSFGPSDAWAVGASSVLRWDGGTWAPFPGPFSATAYFSSVWGADASDVWVAGQEGPGSTDHPMIWRWRRASGWTPYDAGTGTGVYSVWGSGPADVWFTGSGVLLRWNGSSLVVPLSTDAGVWAVVGGTGPSDVWLGGFGLDSKDLIVRWNGAAWTPYAFPAPGPFGVAAIFFAAPDDGWAADGLGVLMRFHR